jgi:hypothetical protein
MYVLLLLVMIKNGISNGENVQPAKAAYRIQDQDWIPMHDGVLIDIYGSMELSTSLARLISQLRSDEYLQFSPCHNGYSDTDIRMLTRRTKHELIIKLITQE